MIDEDKRVLRGNQTMRALEESVAYLLESKEPQSITVDDICAHCGVTKGAFYHHFTSKEEILSRVITSRMSAYMASAITAAQQEYPDDPPRQIVEWINAIASFAIENRSRFAGHFLKGSPSESWSDLVEDWRGEARRRIECWQSEGVLRSDISAQALHQYCDSFTYGMTSLWMQGYITLPLEPVLVRDFVSTMLSPGFDGGCAFDG